MNCERNMNNKTENKEKLLAIQEILMHNELRKIKEGW